MHNNIKEVTDIMKIQNTILRRKKFRKLMVLGISKYNQTYISSKEKIMYINQSAKKGNISYQCNNCMMFYSKHSISQHKKICYDLIPSRKKGSQIAFICDPVTKDLTFLEETFMSEVFDHLHNDNVKRDIASDIEILYIGNFYYLKILTNRTDRRNPSLRSRKLMRCITEFKFLFNETVDVNSNITFSLSDILNLDNWPTFERCIKKMIYKQNNSNLQLKR